MQTPISAISAPTMSNLSGGILSICQPHNIAIADEDTPICSVYSSKVRWLEGWNNAVKNENDSPYNCKPKAFIFSQPEPH